MTSHDNWIDSQINDHVNSLDGSDYSKENIYLEDDVLAPFIKSNGGEELLALAIKETYHGAEDVTAETVEDYLNEEYQKCSELPEHFNEFGLIEEDQKEYLENLLADIGEYLEQIKFEKVA